MSMLISEIQALAGDWRAWGVIALLGLVSLHSIMMLLRCPYGNGTARIDEADAAAAQTIDYTPGSWFALVMVVGIVLSLVGIFMIAEGIKPALALAALVTGLFVIQTQPSRLRIREHKLRVIATHFAEDDIRETARDRLKASYRGLALINLLLLMAVTIGLSAF